MIPVRRQIVSNPTSEVASEVNVNSAPEVGLDEESEVSLNSRNRIRKSVSEVRMYGVPDVDVGLAAESEGHLFRVPDPNHDTHTDQREIALSSHSALKTSMSHTSGWLFILPSAVPIPLSDSIFICDLFLFLNASLKWIRYHIEY